MSRSVSFDCDMGSGNEIRFIEQDDGDVVIVFLSKNGVGTALGETVELCTSGTRYPGAAVALRRFITEAEKAQKEHPRGNYPG